MSVSGEFFILRGPQDKLASGAKTVSQIEFKGERLDMSSVMAWRRRMLGEGSDFCRGAG